MRGARPPAEGGSGIPNAAALGILEFCPAKLYDLVSVWDEARGETCPPPRIFRLTWNAAITGNAFPVEDPGTRRAVIMADQTGFILRRFQGMLHHAETGLRATQAEDPVYQRGHKIPVMGNDEDGGSPLRSPSLELPQDAEKPLLAPGVHVGSGFVQNENFRPGSQSPGGQNPPLLAAGKGAVGLFRQIPYLHLFQCLLHGGPVFAAETAGQGLEPAHLHHLPDGDGKGPVQGRALRYIAHPVRSPGPGPEKTATGLETMAQDLYAPLPGLLQAQEQLENRGLSRAVGPQEGDKFPPVDVEIGLFQDFYRAVGKRNPLETKAYLPGGMFDFSHQRLPGWRFSGPPP